jgi:HTH-type transcriptional regulator/antitoxin MqsA
MRSFAEKSGIAAHSGVISNHGWKSTLHMKLVDLQHAYVQKCETTHISAVTSGFCRACGEVILYRKLCNRHSELMGLFQRQANAAYVDRAYIVNVPQKLDLNQRQAPEIFGEAVNAFLRCENSKTKPPLALVKLLKLLDRHPELPNGIRTA